MFYQVYEGKNKFGFAWNGGLKLLYMAKFIEEIECTQENAKKEYNKGNYGLACKIYEYLWEESGRKNTFLLSCYGRALRKLGYNHQFIDICNTLGENSASLSNQYVIDILCWCIYDVHIKEYSVDNQEGLNEFIKYADFIVNKNHQLDAENAHMNPYVRTVIKVIKIYNGRSSKCYKEIIKWLSYLKADILSEEVYVFKDEEGKERELASPKEFYYQNMAKALEKTGDYYACVEICNKAFNQIEKFHYKNQVWLKERMCFSKCMIQVGIEDAINRYKELSEKEKYWFMYHKLSQIYFRYNRLEEALLFACKAVMRRFEYDKMVNLFLDTAVLWQAIGNNENAKLFFHASAYYRELNGWACSEELRYAIADFKIETYKKPNIILLQKIAQKYVESKELSKRLRGTIMKILPHGGAGFIRPNQGKDNVYFNIKDCDVRKAQVGDLIEYELIKLGDGRCKAINIIKRG